MPTTIPDSALPHFHNSKAAVSLLEPLYLNLFEVVFTPPAGIGDFSILAEHVKKVTGLPEITPNGFVEQHYKFAKRTYAGAKPEDTTAELEFEFEVNLDRDNSMYVYNMLRRWANLQFDTDTGKQGVKADYAGRIQVLIYNRKRIVYRDFNFYPTFMIEPLKNMEMDYLSDEIFVLGCKFKADAWNETRTGADALTINTGTGAAT